MPGGCVSEQAGFTLAPRDRPQTDAAGFDRRLMTPERLLALAGAWPVRFCQVADEFTSLDCARCGKAIEILANQAGAPYTTSPGTILANTLRHAVMSHGLSLSGGNGNAGQ